MLDPWMLTRIVYEAYDSNTDMLDKANRFVAKFDSGPKENKLMGIALLCDEFIRQRKNFDPTNENDPVRKQLDVIKQLAQSIIEVL